MVTQLCIWCCLFAGSAIISICTSGRWQSWLAYFFPLCLNCDTVSLACIICLFPPVGSYSVELIYVLLGKGLLHHVFV